MIISSYSLTNRSLSTTILFNYSSLITVPTMKTSRRRFAKPRRKPVTVIVPTTSSTPIFDLNLYHSRNLEQLYRQMKTPLTMKGTTRPINTTSRPPPSSTTTTATTTIKIKKSDGSIITFRKVIIYNRKHPHYHRSTTAIKNEDIVTDYTTTTNITTTSATTAVTTNINQEEVLLPNSTFILSVSNITLNITIEDNNTSALALNETMPIRLKTLSILVPKQINQTSTITTTSTSIITTTTITSTIVKKTTDLTENLIHTTSVPLTLTKGNITAGEENTTNQAVAQNLKNLQQTRSGVTALVIVLSCTFGGLIGVALFLAFILRRRISSTYLKLPCIHKERRNTDDTPSSASSYSPILGKRNIHLLEKICGYFHIKKSDFVISVMGNQQSPKISPFESASSSSSASHFSVSASSSLSHEYRRKRSAIDQRRRRHSTITTAPPTPTVKTTTVKNHVFDPVSDTLSTTSTVVSTLSIPNGVLKDRSNNEQTIPSSKITNTTIRSIYDLLTTDSSQSTKFVPPCEFSVYQLHDIWNHKHAHDDLEFSIEFKSIPNDDLPCTAATRQIVATKNRFLNILPIDATRVILNVLINDPATDYINANYISGYKCPKKYIATQGPKPDTTEDFWRMIWELKLKSIVMLTNVIEGASRMTKCHQYWPEIGYTNIYGSYRVTGIDSTSLRDYDKRYFHLSKIQSDAVSTSSLTPIDAISSTSSSEYTSGELQQRLIIQYHYTQWPDMDIPVDSHPLINLIKEVNEQNGKEDYPIVVHCSAGVGRTGTYITIDAMIDKIEQEGKIDIYNFVMHMRKERSLMVQTVRQYVFIYRALLEYYLFGYTRIEANLFKQSLNNLRKLTDVNTKTTFLQQEFDKLSLLPVEYISHRDALLNCNLEKNRNSHFVPYDRNRVCLSRILGYPYINASFVEGYTKECSFIITQDPLIDTISEFWRLFVEHESNCIVQLHTAYTNEIPCPIYYPDELGSTMKIGSTTLIKLVHKEILGSKMILREIDLTDTREALSKTIYHFEYLIQITNNDNIQTCTPTTLNDINNLFDFIGQVRKQHRLCGEKYITVHCGCGGPSTSLFCAAIILLDQLKSEHAIDIFQTVRGLQRQRMNMITNLSQYEYLYNLILKFLEESFDRTMWTKSSLTNSTYDNNTQNDEQVSSISCSKSNINHDIY
ncbi:unnamed protein product [Didymodactylos carnosus]|uniref:protein-tyrosine-phosphatase n=1 Tax=Didymodactylos carnosus TaxID=1234261 RepID=A0A813VHM8_9BILA|nr:unnamed protein product [Didymodactylos carnosus]CAF3630604.1 unnamed protein product [Didymodactylos carnosus]